MHKVIAALGLAVAVPVALAAPALAKSPSPITASVTSALRQHDGFRAEVTYLCLDREDEDGTINVVLQQPGADDVSVVAYAQDKAQCDGEEREETIRFAVAEGALRTDRPLQLHTILYANGQEVATHTSPAVSLTTGTPTSTPSPTESATPSPSASPSDAETPETGSPSPSASPSHAETPETEAPSASPSATHAETPETESPSPSASPSHSASATASPSPSATATS